MLFEDVITNHIGEFGRYQKFVFFLACLITIPSSWNNLGIVFLAGVPDHRCTVPGLDESGLSEVDIRNLSSSSLSDGPCKMYDGNFTQLTLSVENASGVGDLLSVSGPNRTAEAVFCPYGHEYSKDVYTNTIVTQWNLVCDRDVLIALASSVYMAGLMSGTLLTGAFSDLCGRRPAFIICLVIVVVSNISLAFSPNFITFTIIRFINGFATIGLFTTAFILVMEVVGAAYRVHVGIAIEYPWAIGYMAYALIAYGIRDWFYLQLATTVPQVALLLIIFVLPESPRWLYSKQKPERGEEVLQKMAKCNHTNLPKPLKVTIKNEKTQYMWDILRTRRMRIRSFIIFFIWFVNSIVYYGLSLGTSSLGGNDFVNFFIAGAVEIPAYLLAQISLTCLGRRWPLFTVMALGGFALLTTTFIRKQLSILTVVLAMTGKFCISSSFAMIYVFTAELYPTVVRQAGLSAASSCARVGGIIAPYIGLLTRFGSYIPLVIFGTSSVAAAFCTLLLPETKGRSLPESMQDGENLGKKAVIENGQIPEEEENKNNPCPTYPQNVL